MNDDHVDEGTITVFAVLNFVFAGLCLLGVGSMALIMIFGLTASGDEGKDLVAGVLGCLVLATPSIIGLIVYAVAGVGLVKRSTWGYYFHIAGGILAALSCLGLIYTVFVFVFAFKPEFKDAFFIAEADTAPLPGEQGDPYNRAEDDAFRRELNE